MKNYTIRYLVVALLVLSCNKHPNEKDVISEEQFVKLYADMTIIYELGKVTNADSAINRHRIDSLYQHYHVRSEQVRETIDVYNRDIERWKGFLEKVGKRLDSLQAVQNGKSKK